MQDLYIKLFIALIVILLLLPNSFCNLITQKKDIDDIGKKLRNNIVAKREIDKTIEETQKLINHIEETEKASHPTVFNVNGGPDLDKGIRNEHRKMKEVFGDVVSNSNLMLFYTLSCPHSQAFLPIWYRIKNKLPSYVESEEIDCGDESNRTTCNNHNITGVPSVILSKDGHNIVFNGSRTESALSRFLREHGITLNQNDHEGFVDFNTNNLLEDIEKKNEELADAKCPTVTFDKYLDRTKEEYAFQIFDENGLYGYSKGGKNAYLDEFHAAYNCFDTYLSTLPIGAEKDECAMKYRSQVRDFGLCDADKLNEMLDYDSKIKKGELKERIDGTNYENNTGVINAIKKACMIE